MLFCFPFIYVTTTFAIVFLALRIGVQMEQQWVKKTTLFAFDGTFSTPKPSFLTDISKDFPNERRKTNTEVWDAQTGGGGGWGGGA